MRHTGLLILVLGSFVLVSEAAIGKPACRRKCNYSFGALCGTNGRTYFSPCSLGNAKCTTPNLKIAYYGECDPCRNYTCPSSAPPYARCMNVYGNPRCHCWSFCPLRWNPVCASDGKTYMSDCEMKKASCEKRTKLTIVTRGPCARISACKRKCDYSFGVVCGTNGRTYSNPCSLRNAKCTTPNLKIAYYGECDPCRNYTCPSSAPPYARCMNVYGNPRCHCLSFCPLRWNPVCASDGKTYMSDCEMKKASCEKRTKLTIVTRGPCARKSACKRKCDYSFGVVCGTNGRTYFSPCSLRNAKCTTHDLKIAYYGECDPCRNYTCPSSAPPYSRCVNVYGNPRCYCWFICNDDRHPVCASDGKTYNNYCEMKKASCKKRTKLTIVTRGPCAIRSCKRQCDSSFAPVCGTNRRTYTNVCHLSNAMCTSSALRLAYRGVCDPCRNYRCPSSSPPYARCVNVYGRPRCKCLFICPRLYKPVCASDGKTYPNNCERKKASCVRGKRLHVVRRGECPVTDPCRKYKCPTSAPPYARCMNVYGRPRCNCLYICPRLYKPVCASDGKTYKNYCEMKKVSCDKGTKLTAVKKGACAN